MKITVFTSNQPRHISLINNLASISDEVFAIQECNTVFPGEVDDFFKRSDIMQQYFRNVISAENNYFGDISFLPRNVRSLSIKTGDLSRLPPKVLEQAMQSDLFVVFGASYIRGWLIDELVAKKAINIHMGISPYYRGSSCNFWALYDNNPHYVGSTIHMLSKGLDSGEMLYHAIPRFDGEEPFEFTMKSVKAAHESLVDRIASGKIHEMGSHKQDKTQEVRYTRNKDFDDRVAGQFLERNLSATDLGATFAEAEYPSLLHPYWY